MIRPLLPLVILVSGCVPYEPPLRPTGDDRMREVLNGIGGSISLIGPEAPGPTIVLLFDDRFPGPPEGTDQPVDFATVGPDEYSHAGEGTTTFATDTGQATAPLDLGWHASWSASELPDGAYQVEAIVDLDGDFSPVASTLGGATCGDWQGFYEPDPGSGVKGAVRVADGQILSGVSLTVRDELTTERPAFVFPDEGGYRRMSLGALGNEPTGIAYTLRATGVHAAFDGGDGNPIPFDLDDPCIADAAEPRFCVPETTCQAAFSVWYPDKDADGAIDPHPDFGDFGLKDVWPRVFIQYMGTAELVDGEPVRDVATGYPAVTPYEPEEPGVFWATENFTYGQEGAFGLAMAPVDQPTKFPRISVMFPPLVAKFYPAGHPFCTDQGEAGTCMQVFDLSIEEERAQVPRGIWSVNIISWTGQTWGMPNELSEWGVAATAETFDAKSQGGFILTVD